MAAKECRDCKAERERRGDPPPKHYRPIKRAGRCHTHDVQFRRQQKSGAHERRVQQVYGLPPGAYQRMYVFQGQVCAICRRSTGNSRRLSVDHDHRSGLVRGLLCRPCNDFLGWIRDDPEAGRRLYQYLTNPPAKLLEILAVHEDFRGEAS
jgi:hypothetical protein